MIKFTNAAIVLLAIFSVQIVVAQSVSGVKGKTSKKYVQNIKRLDGLPDINPSANIRVPNKNWEVPVWPVDKNKIIYEEAVGAYHQPRQTRETSPAPDTSFHALEDNGSSIPPDVNGCAGPNHLMITLNTGVRIQDRQGNNLFSTSLSNFWDVLPGNGGTFDPKIIYDPYNNRWIMVTPSGSNSVDSKLYLGVSQTSDPLGDWNMYWIDPDESNHTWFDYPSIGFNKKWITISGNMFGGDFYRTVFVFDKMAVYNGDDDVNFTRFATTQGFTIVPSITYDTIVEDQYLISTSNGNTGGMGYINKFKLDGPLDNPQFQFEGSIGIPEPWANGAGDQGNFLPQMGSPELINSVDARMENVIYRNGKLWAVHHVFLPADNPQRTAVQWWNLDTEGVILERGRVDDTTNVFSFAFATIAVNKKEDVFIGFDVFSGTQYASAGYAYKSHYDEAGSMRAYYQFKDGLSPYYKTFGGGRNRWGDYSNTCVDPVNDLDFWTIQEYAELSNTANEWGTWWAYMRPAFEPETDFEADNLLIPVGETVNFQDLTAGVPDNWTWSFPGADPSSSNDQNPAAILYETEGSFDVELISSNQYGEDTLIKENFITTSSTILPEVSFSHDKTVVCLGDVVRFRDNTIYSPIQWDWQFNPSTVSFVNGTDQNSQNPEVVFVVATTYSVSLTVWNLNGSSEHTEFEAIVAGGYEPYFNEDFENGLDLRFWEVENPDDDITWEILPVLGYTHGAYSAGINLNDYYNFTERDRLVSPALNFEGMSKVILEFDHAYAKKYPQISDSLIVLISDDCGASWQRLLAMGDDGSGNFATHELLSGGFVPATADDWCGSGYGSQCNAINLDAYAGKSNIRIAFESYNANGNQLYIDNVHVSQFVGIDETGPANDGISVYPNPSESGFVVSFSNSDKYTKLQVVDLFGEVIAKRKINTPTERVVININENLEAGIYFVRISGEFGFVSKKIVVF
jgi:PKD repeat protein